MEGEKNSLKYLGFMGLLGLLGFLTDNTGFYGFFGFFGFFAFQKITPDERFKANVSKAGRNAFFLSLVIFALSSVYVTLTSEPMAYIVGFAANFALQVLVFTFSLQYYEKH
ncbi:MAG: DUF3796 domain-containing protein [Firmicutes bacterium]|nr:DUF3796 domain-containing protein [Bacillota bacterium]